VVDSLKALDPEWPIREADMARLAAGSTRSQMTDAVEKVGPPVGAILSGDFDPAETSRAVGVLRPLDWQRPRRERD